jgi:hypothetical protein
LRKDDNAKVVALALKGNKLVASNFETMVDFFRQDKWNAVAFEDEQILQMSFRGHSSTWRCYAHARQDPGQVIFYSAFPFAVPEEKRLKVAEFLTRVNYGLLIGNFELDFNDGEVRYKTSISVDEEPVTFGLLRPIVYTNVALMDQYFNGLLTVIQGPESAAEIAALVELFISG